MRTQETSVGEDMKDSISSRLLSFIYKLDTEFPLSGGETEEDMHMAMDYVGHEAHELLRNVDADFPLSGGA